MKAVLAQEVTNLICKDGKVEHKEVEYLTWKSLNRANNRAIKLNLNRQIKRSYIKSLDRGCLYPVSFTLWDEGWDGRPDVIRHLVTTGLDDKGAPITCQLDIPIPFVGTDVLTTVLKIKS